MSQVKDERAAMLLVIRDAVCLLGALSVRGPDATLSNMERRELNAKLFECLEYLNNAREDS